MSQNPKEQQEILDKLGIEQLNPMQIEAQEAINSNPNVVLISPTGTGKTLAFLLPIINNLDRKSHAVQVLILVPSRELAIQIDQVIREMGAGFKTNAVYGGRAFSKDKLELLHNPAILIGTPGRIAAHFRRATFLTNQIETLIIDEFDKSLEIGFEPEMKEILLGLTNLKKRILTSATQEIEIPKFVGLEKPTLIRFANEGSSKLKIKIIISPTNSKLETLVETLHFLGNQPGIIFCNYKDSVQRVSDLLSKNKIQHGCFHGDMEQKDRERVLLKFRNGTHQVIVATDLAARGLDIPELKFIIHFELPFKSQEFTHRNGRTARMKSDGTAYVLRWEREELPDFISSSEIENITSKPIKEILKWQTLFISGGRKDKISKGDIAGLFLKQGNLKIDELGIIELKLDCAFVAVPTEKADKLIKELNNSKLKRKKVRITLI